MIMLTETWSSGKNSYVFDGFDHLYFHRNYNHARAKRAAGGQDIFIRKETSKVIFNDVLV